MSNSAIIVGVPIPLIGTITSVKLPYLLLNIYLISVGSAWKNFGELKFCYSHCINPYTVALLVE